MNKSCSVLSLISSYIMPALPSVKNMITHTTMLLFIRTQINRLIWFCILLKIFCWYNAYQIKVVIIIFINKVTQLSSLFAPKSEHIWFFIWKLFWSTKKEVFFIRKLTCPPEYCSSILSVETNWIHLTTQKLPILSATQIT